MPYIFKQRIIGTYFATSLAFTGNPIFRTGRNYLLFGRDSFGAVNKFDLSVHIVGNPRECAVIFGNLL